MITYFIYRLQRPFLPSTHPWKTIIPYDDWIARRTALCRQFDLVMGVSFAMFAAVLVKILWFGV